MNCLQNIAGLTKMQNIPCVQREISYFQGSLFDSGGYFEKFTLKANPVQAACLLRCELRGLMSLKAFIAVVRQGRGVTVVQQKTMFYALCSTFKVTLLHAPFGILHATMRCYV